MKRNEIIKEIKKQLVYYNACKEVVLITSAKTEDGYRFEFALIEYDRTTDYIRIDYEDNELELFKWVDFRGYFADWIIKNIQKAIEHVNELLIY